MRKESLSLVLLLSLVGCWDFDALLPTASQDMASPPVMTDMSDKDLQCQRNPLVEDCSNGIDDNGDCRVDCEDDDCKRSDACKITSYGELKTSTGVVTAPTCAAGQTPSGSVLYQGIDGSSKVCTGCDCNTPTCSVPKVQSFASNACTAGTGTTVAQNLATGACVNTNPMPAAGAFFYVDAPKAACTPKAAAGAITPAFQQRAQLCQAQAMAGCQFLDCLTPTAFAKLCLTFATDPKYCPAPFTQRVTNWQRTYNDARTCACSCTAPPAGMDCAGIVTAYSVAACGMAATQPPVDLSAQCAAGPTNTMTMMPAAALGLKSSYAPIAGAKCGAVPTIMGNTPTLSGATVLCCQP